MKRHETHETMEFIYSVSEIINDMYADDAADLMDEIRIISVMFFTT